MVRSTYGARRATGRRPGASSKPAATAAAARKPLAHGQSETLIRSWAYGHQATASSKKRDFRAPVDPVRINGRRPHARRAATRA